ncbi:M20 family metallo-hydrolase [Sporomusa acidovorans]|uniref:N-carbamoyl-L-amino acid hydrolase n=1 Tax=Sporomusa acidovorans (strain ATCC 49682 / DSM 3132 / Mol) TaxID=1123286 RepID=A0ABZ3J686_SPOA4|nr:M20 family metallo-hydrolase [Sporomusa acidovorans]OZC15389.1 N-carbamoyl-L-amino acid hydrolase [Sporomusa acidovorans DSM 3132]SDF13591.1 N-carbamoyl-L-amino-acid hydrolase [Sporomusa acidovorans]
MVDCKRLEKNFHKMAAIGLQANGGFTRLAFSDEDWQARELIIRLMEQAGLAVRTDAFGNVIGRQEGIEPAAAVVMAGSHLDSVPQGGNFDGVAGVLAAIEALQCLKKSGEQHYHPLEVVVFMAEESSRFGMATLGSKAFCGKLTVAQLHQWKDSQEISLAAALRQRGLQPENICQARYPGNIKAFLELHIEQGKVLETTKKQIGIVTGIAAPTRLRVTITGQADHSGATPMNMRQDALTAAARIILAVEEVAGLEAQHGVVGTTGIVKAEPGVMNVIPGRVELGIDIRGISLDSKQCVVQGLLKKMDEIKNQRNVGIEPVILTDEPPVQLAPTMVEMLYAISREQHYASMLMPSGAGHDAMHLAALAPTGMVFIPCRGGISHNPAEWARLEDIAAGTEIILAAIRKLSQRNVTIA